MEIFKAVKRGPYLTGEDENPGGGGAQVVELYPTLILRTATHWRTTLRSCGLSAFIIIDRRKGEHRKLRNRF